MVSETVGDYEVTSDGRTVWVNTAVLAARFGPIYYEVINGAYSEYRPHPSETGPTTAEWEAFVGRVYEVHGVAVEAHHKPSTIS